MLSFADIAHQILTFDESESFSDLVLKLLKNRWIQRLRRISQTGNTKLVYMYAEHSRFGHSLGAAFLATMLLKHLSYRYSKEIAPYKNAIVAAALLHDIGHLAPGSHLAEKVWSTDTNIKHEFLTCRIITEDHEIRSIVESHEPGLLDKVIKILSEDVSLPSWTKTIISGDGWNVDRGNWSIVDSTLCAVNYGRYNVNALIDSFCLTKSGELVITENRMDALCHFFVARDSMYRQIYQHRVSQSVDTMVIQISKRLRNMLAKDSITQNECEDWAKSKNIFCDTAMKAALWFNASFSDLLHVFRMTEDWWQYHLSEWCSCGDAILSDLSKRIRDRNIFKTIRVENIDDPIIAKAHEICIDSGLDPDYYCLVINSSDYHRVRLENPPSVLLENGNIVPVTEIEPIVANLFIKSLIPRIWISVPEEIKSKLRRLR